MRRVRVRLLDLLACIAIGGLLLALAPVAADDLYPLDWLSGIGGFLLALLALLAVLGPRHAWLWGLAGLLVGGVVGHVVGEPVWRRGWAEVEELRAAGQDVADPSHPGWWIALLIFAVAALLGVVVHRRRGRRSTSAPSDDVL